jgi:hypothetical protein
MPHLTSRPNPRDSARVRPFARISRRRSNASGTAPPRGPAPPGGAAPLRARARLRAAIGAVVGLAALAAITPAASAGTQADTALDWFDETADTVAAAGVPAQSVNSRTWAVSWIAAARAVRDVDRGYGRAAETPALATAVHDALAAQIPSRAPELDAALAATLAGIADGRRKDAGVAAGRRAAAETLAARAGDGLDLASVNIPFEPSAPRPAHGS